MHTLLQAAIVAVSLAAPTPKPVPAPHVVQVNLGVTRVLPTSPKPVAVVLPKR
jgi:hypothetical protein